MLDREAGQIGHRILRIENLAIEEGFKPPGIGSGNFGDTHGLRRHAPQISAIHGADQCLDVGVGRQFAPADILRQEPAVVALEWKWTFSLPVHRSVIAIRSPDSHY